MKKFLFLFIVLLGFVLWPLTTWAGQTAVPLLTPTPSPTSSCSTVTVLPSSLSAHEGQAMITTTPTPSATPCATVTSTPTVFPPFSATVDVIPSKTWLDVGETLLVHVTLEVSQGCQFPILELTLSQETEGEPPFAPSEPIVLGPGVAMPTTITLTAVNSGTTTFHATLFGEQNCGQGWIWTYTYGESVPVTVGDALTPTWTPQPSTTPMALQTPVYVPMLRRD